MVDGLHLLVFCVPVCLIILSQLSGPITSKDKVGISIVETTFIQCPAVHIVFPYFSLVPRPTN